MRTNKEMYQICTLSSFYLKRQMFGMGVYYSTISVMNNQILQFNNNLIEYYYSSSQGYYSSVLK